VQKDSFILSICGITIVPQHLKYQYIIVMKKIFITIAALLGFAVASADDRAITEQQLPTAARSFIHTHYANHKVVVASQDRNIFNTDYTALLDDGSKIEFDNKGNWESVAHKGGKIPQGIIPTQIAQFVQQHFPASHITKIEHDRQGYEVKLQGDTELKFDNNLNCVDIER